MVKHWKELLLQSQKDYLESKILIIFKKNLKNATYNFAH